MLIGKLSIGMSADSGPLKKDLAKGKDAVKDFANAVESSESSFTKFSASLSKMKVGVGALAAAWASSKIAAGIMDVTRKAATLEEGINKLDAVFGSSSSSVKTFGRNLSDRFGIDVNETVSNLGRIGSMLGGAGFDQATAAQMSNSLVDLANDLSRFNDTSFEVAFQKLRSGLAGESEPLRDFGIFLTEANVKARALQMGLGGLGRDLTDAEKIQARANIVFEQSGPAIGAANREMDGTSAKLEALSGRWENLKTTVGGIVAPVVGGGIGVINSALDVLTTAWDRNTGAAAKWGDTVVNASDNAAKAMSERVREANEGAGTSWSSVAWGAGANLLDTAARPFRVVGTSLKGYRAMAASTAASMGLGVDAKGAWDQFYASAAQLRHDWMTSPSDELALKRQNIDGSSWAPASAATGMVVKPTPAPIIADFKAEDRLAKALHALTLAAPTLGIGSVAGITGGITSRAPSPLQVWQRDVKTPERDEPRQTSFASAMTRGSVEATRAVLAHRYGGARDPVANNTKRSADLLGKVQQGIQKLNDTMSARNDPVIPTLTA